MAASQGFSTEVDWIVRLQPDRTILHEITVTLHNVSAGIFSFTPTSTTCRLDPNTEPTWLGTDVLEPAGAKLLTTQWGFHRDKGTFDVVLVDLPIALLNADLVQLRAQCKQDIAVDSVLDVRIFRLDVACLPAQAQRANLTVRCFTRNRAERFVERILRGARLLPKDRILVRSSATVEAVVEINQADGVIHVPGTEIRAPVEVSYLEISVWTAALQYGVTFLAGLLPFLAREAGQVLLRR